MSDSSQNSTTGSAVVETGVNADDLTQLMSAVRKLNAEAVLLRNGSKALYDSVRQIVFVARDNGSVQYEMIVDILKKNGALSINNLYKNCS